MQVGGSDVVVDGASCDGRTELVKAIQGQNAGVSAVLLCRSLLLKKCRMCHSYRPCVLLRRTARGHPRLTRVADAVAGYGASRNLLGCIVPVPPGAGRKIEDTTRLWVLTCTHRARGSSAGMRPGNMSCICNGNV